MLNEELKKFILKLNWNYILLFSLFGVVFFSIVFYYNYQNIASTLCGCSDPSQDLNKNINLNQNGNASKETFSTESNIDSKIQSNIDNTIMNKPASPIKGEIIMYYASWCGYSKQILPEWDKFEKFALENLPQIIPTKIRCESDNEALCMQKGIEGYPTIILYPNDNTEVVFNEERTAEKLIEFVQSNLGL
jgi:thiol-disulfide isomerase/thioredoxin